MEQIILTRKDGISTFNLFQNSPLRTVTKAEQSSEIFGENVVNMTFESSQKFDFLIGDYLTIFEKKYKLNQLPRVSKNSSRKFVYELVFEGVEYELIKVLFTGVGRGERFSSSEFSAIGNLKFYANILINNLNRVYPNEWVLGNAPESEDLELNFAGENCLAVINRICAEFGYEYRIETIGLVNTVYFEILGDVIGHQFEYGRGKGLYAIERTNESVDSSLITRLYVEGGEKNIKTGYRSYHTRLQLGATPYIENNPSVAKYGIIEGYRQFGDIYPKRKGVITAVSNLTSFVDSSMDFDLNETNANGTVYLVAGTAAKIAFKSGNLAGYEFEVTSYNHSNKSFVIKTITDERALTFPNTDGFAMQVGDEYTILDINMPESYVQNAESDLNSKAIEVLYNNSTPKVSYLVGVDEAYIKKADIYRVLESPNDPLPAPYQYANIGISGGFAQYLTSGFVMKTQGNGLGNNGDQLGYLYIPSGANSSLSAILKYQNKYASGAVAPNTLTAGVMVRLGNSATDKLVAFEVNNQGTCKLFRRYSVGNGNLEQVGASQTIAGVKEIKLQRNGLSFKAYYKKNSTWVLFGETSLTGTSSELQGATIGIWGCGMSNSEYALLRIDKVEQNLLSSIAPTTGGLPVIAPWTNSNIATSLGILDYTVRTNIEQTGFSMLHSGGDVWGASDSFGFVHRQITDLFTLSGIIVAESFYVPLNNEKSPFARRGIMIRESVAVDSKYFAVSLNHNGSLFCQYRLTTGGETIMDTNIAIGKGSVNNFRIAKLKEDGKDYVAGYYNEGRFWVLVAKIEMAFGATARVGFFNSPKNSPNPTTYQQAINISFINYNDQTPITNTCNKPTNLASKLVSRGVIQQTI